MITNFKLFESSQEEDFDTMFRGMIKKIKTFEDVQTQVYGHFGPFNPIEPYRSLFIEQFKEVLKNETDKIKKQSIQNIIGRLELTWEPTPDLPEGAMY